MTAFFITGTDTSVGKTVAAAWAVQQLNACYWKPIQSGLEEETDTQFVQRVLQLDRDRIIPSRFELKQPFSPHLAARLDQVSIKVSDFTLPQNDRPLIVEGAGGVLVPLNEEEMMADLMNQLKLPIILVCRTSLGTINHSLLSIEALRQRGIEIAGVIFNGDENQENKAAILNYGSVRLLGEIPHMPQISKDTLSQIKPAIPVAQWSGPVAQWS